MFDALASEEAYNFSLTPDHLPSHTDSAPAFTVIPPSAVHMDRGPPRGARGPGSSGGRGGYRGYQDTASSSSSTFGSQDIRYRQVSVLIILYTHRGH